MQSNKRILITGASEGIGRAAALELARQGHSLVLCARRAPMLEAVAEQIRRAEGDCQVVVMDVTQQESVAAGVAAALAQGALDVVVNNAGSCAQREFLFQSEAEQRHEMELNYFGAQRVIRAVLPHFIRRGAGHIVNVSSLLASASAPTTANYCGSKAALEAFSRALRGEVEPLGVRVSIFVAPHTQTEQGKRVEFKGVKSLPVAYVARRLARTVQSAPRTGTGSPVYTGLLKLNAWFPGFMDAQMRASVRHLQRARPSLVARLEE